MNIAPIGAYMNTSGGEADALAHGYGYTIMDPAKLCDFDPDMWFLNDEPEVKIPVVRDGFVSQDMLTSQLDNETLLVSIAPVNHEIGVIQDILAIVDLVKDRNAEIKVHLDACDAFMKIPLNLEATGADLASFSSHKVYGPKGAGALYIREGVELKPVIHGQLSTQKLWAGIENIPAITGFASATSIMEEHFDDYTAGMTRLRDRLITGITDTVDQTLLNGPAGAKRSSGQR